MPNSDSTYNAINPFVFPVGKHTAFTEFLRQQDEAFHFGEAKSDSTVIVQPLVKLNVSGKSNFYNLTTTKTAHEIKSFEPNNKDWITGLLLIMIIGFVILKKNFTKPITNIFNAFWNYRHIYHLNREGSILASTNYYILIFLSLLSLSLSLYFVFFYFIQLPASTMSGQVLLFVKTFLGLFMALTLKSTVLFLLNRIFSLQKLFEEYLLAQTLFIIVSGIFMLILSIFYTYTTINLILLSKFIIISVFYVLYVYRLFVICEINSSVSLFHFFLYLCTFEVLPVLFIYKLIKI